MKKRLIRAIPIGFFWTMLVTLIVQFAIAQSGKGVVTPTFAARFANESAAVLAQSMLVGFIGMTFAGSARIFEIEKWSFLKQGIVHFLITAAVWMPIAWFCWSPFPKEVLWYSGLGWFASYAITWTVQYLLWKKKVRDLNRSIRRYRNERD